MWRCPRCNDSIRIFNARTTIITYFDGTEVDGDMEWDDDNEAECVSCDWTGAAGEALVEEFAI